MYQTANYRRQRGRRKGPKKPRYKCPRGDCEAVSSRMNKHILAFQNMRLKEVLSVVIVLEPVLSEPESSTIESDMSTSTVVQTNTVKIENTETITKTASVNKNTCQILGKQTQNQKNVLRLTNTVEHRRALPTTFEHENTYEQCRAPPTTYEHEKTYEHHRAPPTTYQPEKSYKHRCPSKSMFYS